MSVFYYFVFLKFCKELEFLYLKRIEIALSIYFQEIYHLKKHCTYLTLKNKISIEILFNGRKLAFDLNLFVILNVAIPLKVSITSGIHIDTFILLYIFLFLFYVLVLQTRNMKWTIKHSLYYSSNVRIAPMDVFLQENFYLRYSYFIVQCLGSKMSEM